MQRWLVLLALLPMACGDDKGSCPDQIVDGDACDEAGLACVRQGSTCGSYYDGLARCDCTAGRWTCSDAGQPECASGLMPEGTSCGMEGTGTCDSPPAGGHCSCSGGVWSCVSACPDWCPGAAPRTDTACPQTAEGQTCSYSGGGAVTCTCTSGKLGCH